MARRIAYLGVFVVVSALLLAPVSGAGAVTDAPTTDDDPKLHVDLSEDGDATVSLVTVSDFADEDERDAFETLEADEDAQTELLDRFADRMQETAERSIDDVDREMTVTADAVDVRTGDDRGVVVLSVHWQNLGAVDGSNLVVTEPFASGYEADRPVVVTAPADSTVETVTPEPTDRSDRQVTWASGTDFDGFEATIALPSDGAVSADDTTGGDDSVPGFGSVVAGSAVLVLIGLTLRCRG
ncbi:hypothetical protein [Natrialba sp. INN-245]|uniref:DUF7345 domain-containing protein n=1 Tax=Natrialba sp. INN-245 TaxID=2690967 RepID=UPI0013133E3A|nr:hypothetical protein [Natrialba sp. INN-245]MWV38567.1 hypothetical protein [Natrialba sp. INN-245]